MRSRSVIERAFTLTAIASVITCAWACSSSSDDSNGSGPSNDAGSSDSSSPNDAATTDANVSQHDGGTSIDSGLPYVGTIGITSSPNFNDVDEPIGTFDVSFSQSGPFAGCTQTTEGICTVTDCTNEVIGGDGGPPLTAGTVTINGGTLGSPAIFTPNSYGLYESMQTDGVPFTVGQTFDISATGGLVTAFSGTSAAAVGDITLTAPHSEGDAGSYGGIYTIDRSQDLSLTWTGGTAGANVAITISQNSIDAECVADSGSGSATIPKAALGHFAAGTETGYVILFAAAMKTLNSSNASVLVSLNSNPTHGKVTFQ
jgi:hypothetical protein